jgi:hypothetical protein
MSETRLSFVGRLTPEREPVTVTLPRYNAKVDDLGIEYEGQVFIHKSQVLAKIRVTSDLPDPFTMKNVVVSDVMSSIDLIGLKWGGWFDLDPISLTNEETKEGVFFENQIPSVAGDASSIQGGDLIAVGGDLFLQSALADFREAMKDPIRTAVACYRAVEGLMHSMMPEAASGNTAKEDDWRRFRDNLNIEKDLLMTIKRKADGPRHGRPASIADDERRRMLTATKALILRYLTFVKENRSALDPTKFPQLTA